LTAHDRTERPLAASTAEGRTLAEQVAWACRILAAQGYQDLTLGHVSARSADGLTMFIKRKGPALGEVLPTDVLEFDLGGDLADAPAEMHLEAVLHTEVYRRRPDVRCVVHGHPPYATAFSATDAKFEFLTHDGVLFLDGVSTYDGVPDLIINADQGGEVADALGERSALLLRNHGVLLAERDVPWAVLTAVMLEQAIRLQAIASSLGRLRPIPGQWLERIHSRKYQDGFPMEYWAAWIRELRRDGKAFDMPGSDA
jgi:L-fuculose-phosphate aldolase